MIFTALQVLGMIPNPSGVSLMGSRGVSEGCEERPKPCLARSKWSVSAGPLRILGPPEEQLVIPRQVRLSPTSGTWRQVLVLEVPGLLVLLDEVCHQIQPAGPECRHQVGHGSVLFPSVLPDSQRLPHLLRQVAGVFLLDGIDLGIGHFQLASQSSPVLPHVITYDVKSRTQIWGGKE